jgi:predicted transcriptional regulator
MHYIIQIMPRIARPETPEAARVRTALIAHIRSSGRSVNAFAQERNIQQSTLWRFLSGRTKTVTPSIRAVINSLHNFSIPGIDAAAAAPHNARLAAAVDRVCAINPRLSESLASLIDALLDASSDKAPPAR